ncbi:MAG: cytochrome c, partial [Proteobacteria bacterium]|nr:cytochrome c [Pseudomonadota bacterium]
MSKTIWLAGLSVAAGLAVVASGVSVAQDPIAARKALMKDVGKATKESVQMVKGEAPYDAAKAKANMELIAKNTGEFVTKFPKGSEKGGETKALPSVWEKFADFEAKSKKQIAAATAAAGEAAKGADAFKAAFGAVG